MNRKRNILIVAIILMAVGFAGLTTNLIINGNVAVSNNASDYDIKFTRVSLEGIENNNLIKESGKKIVYETKKLTTLGDTSELIYEITNNSSQYDAEVTIKCAAKGETTHKDLYEINTSNTPNIIKAKTSESGSIKVSLSKETMEEIREEFECELTINALERTSIGKKEYKEEILNGADPVISKELIPVTLSNDGVVTYADVSKEWYRYENKNWANAVILKENPSKEYQVNEVIEESDIESYFVWIPRYRYQLFHAEQEDGYIEGTPLEESIAQEIKIEFESKDINVSNGTINGEWLTHPAFTNFDTNGIWVGKFETSRNNNKIEIKPNVTSWRNETVKTFFTSSYNYKREMDSHMMKNTEWGAVAYLSHSIYGINDEVRINNNSDNLTGYSAVLKPTCYSRKSTTCNQYSTNSDETLPYNTEIGYLASTTGNITGVYDMSGGAWEFVASYIEGEIGRSDFTIEEMDQYNQYFDKYPTNSTTNSYSNRILGDAIGEMGPFYYYADDDDTRRYHNNWYSGEAFFVEEPYSWFIRGGLYNNGVLADQFDFDRITGDANIRHSFRLVLSY